MRTRRSYVVTGLLAFLAAGLLSVLGLFLAHGNANASPTCTDSWVGSTGVNGTNWGTAANWSTNKAPTSTDYVCMAASPQTTNISIASGITVSAAGINWPTSGSLTINGQLNLGIDGSTIFSVNVPSSGTFQMAGSATTGVAVGSFTLNGGALTATNSGATMTVSSTGTLEDSPSVENVTYIASGTTTLASGSPLYMYQSSSIQAASGGTIALTDHSGLATEDSSANTAVIASGGTLSYNSATIGNNANVGVPLTLNGAAVANRGTLEISDGGSIGPNASGTQTNGGAVSIESEINEPSGETGDIGGMTLASDGTYAGPGGFEVLAGQTTYFQGGSLNGAIVGNAGTIDLAAGDNNTYFYNAAALNNAGTINFTDTGGLSDGDGTANIVTNESTGTWAYNGSSSSMSAWIAVAADDNGTADVSRGTLYLDNNSTVGPDQKTEGGGVFEFTSNLAPETGQIGVISNMVPGGDSEFSGPGTLEIPAGQSATWDNGNIGGGADIVNDGTLTLQPDFVMYVYNASTLENALGGTIDLGDSSGIDTGDGTANLLQNDQGAAIDFTASSGSESAYLGTSLLDSGTLSASFGQLDLTYEVTVTPTAVATTTDDGQVVIDDNAQPPAHLTGSIAGMTLAGDSTLSGPGTLTVPTGSSFTLRGGTLQAGVILANSGTLTLINSESIGFANGSQIQNSGSFVFQDSSTIYDDDNTGNEIINEASGTLSYQGSSKSLSVSIEPPISNLGTLSALEGTMQLNLMSASFPETGTSGNGTLTGGTYHVDGTLQINDIAQITGGSTSEESSPNLTSDAAILNVGGGGAITTSSGTLTALTSITSAGTFNVATNLTLSGKLSNSGVLDVGGDTLIASGGFSLLGGSNTTVNSGATIESGPSGAGTVNLVVPTGTLGAPVLAGSGSVEGVVTNGGGSVSPSLSGAPLSITGSSGSYTQQSVGGGAPSFGVTIASPGTSAGTNFTQLADAGAATLGGALDITSSGYTPTSGDTFTILTAKSIAGHFASINGATIGSSGLDFAVTYTSTTVVLKVTPPAVTGVTPNPLGRGATNVPVIITGVGFGASPTVSGVTGVSFTKVVEANDQTITADASVASTVTTGSGGVTVTPSTGTAVSCTSCLTIDAAPTVSSLSPSTVAIGAAKKSVTVSGTGFNSPSTHALSVSITGPGSGVTATLSGTVAAKSFTLLVSVASTAKTGEYSISVKNGDYGVGGCSNCLKVELVPTVKSLSPSKVGQGATSLPITITGTYFATGATVTSSNTKVTFKSVKVVKSTEITADVSVSSTATTGAASVTVADSGQGSGTTAKAITVDAAPHPTSVSPSSLKEGANSSVVYVKGTGFVSKDTVKFSGTGVTDVVVSNVGSTEIEIKVTVSKTASATKYSVTVTNPDGGTATCSNCFTVAKATAANRRPGLSLGAVRGQAAARGLPATYAVEYRNSAFRAV